MYESEERRIKDGEPALNVRDTFRIHSTVYVLSDEADAQFLNALAGHDYIVKAGAGDYGYVAERSHKASPDEIINGLGALSTAMPLSFIVDMRYADGRKHKLEEPDLYKTVLSAASQRSDLGYYNRPNDRFFPEIIGRMGAFVTNLVDVKPALWHEFVHQAQFLHAQDFIKAFAAWSSKHSDGAPRKVRVDLGAYETVTVLPDDKFRPRPGGGMIFRLG
ncbi:MAG: hypothetical protein DI626_03960 [Micavibrio aeruginosavorus]|uniref:Uncharacterized protein n=1 Tax=Micavibrio aeruginosavorus TaxID=349221 RepID=A0A2W5A2D5_9BACT|nr:MAG: hypothetical protein DI626_03960 [Micavibrio aeruginosavorus]